MKTGLFILSDSDLLWCCVEQLITQFPFWCGFSWEIIVLPEGSQMERTGVLRDDWAPSRIKCLYCCYLWREQLVDPGLGFFSSSSASPPFCILFSISSQAQSIGRGGFTEWLRGKAVSHPSVIRRVCQAQKWIFVLSAPC